MNPYRPAPSSWLTLETHIQRRDSSVGHILPMARGPADESLFIS
jgi:hypothetical protein